MSASDTLFLDSTRVLHRGEEYVINYRFGTIRFDSVFVASCMGDTSIREKLVRVAYRYLPFKFQGSYYRRRLVTLIDSTGRDTIKVSKPKATFGLDDIFGPNLQKSGSIVRGFSIGSNKDLSLNSGLRMQLSGKIASDIDVVAALTDENTPIQPEGTTQTLQEFDKVFVEIRSTDVTATLGDFNLDMTGTEFAHLSRKLQGARGVADYRLGFTNGSTMISGASPRGKYNTNQFQGLDAVQGPYRLTGKNNERSIIVIAGTEKVFIDGEQMTRGETNQYVIDYSTGEVTFTARKLITSASRIVIDFEYTDRQYSRSFFATQTSTSLLDNKARLSFSYIREADDPDAPIDFTITDSAKQVLANAGADRNKARLDGVTRDTANGFYRLRDTTIAINGRDTLVHFYVYAPGDSNAVYTIIFSSVGFGSGDYIRQQLGVFVWKGPGGGDYLPVRFLPLPQSHQLMDATLELLPTSDIKITGEFGRSVFDANRFSSIDDNYNAGHAINVSASFTPRKVEIGGRNIGAFDLQLKERYVNSRFVPIDRTNDIEFNRKWGIDSLKQSDEEIQEASLKYIPTSTLSLSSGYGKITRGPQLKSIRNDGVLNMLGEGLPTAKYFLESIRSRDVSIDNSSSWLRQKGSIEYLLWKIVPSFRYENEDRKIRLISNQSLQPGSFRYNLFAPGLKVVDIRTLSFSTEFEWRADNVFNNGSVIRESRSATQAYALKFSESNELTSSLDITLRNKTYSQSFKQLGNVDVKTVLVRNQTRYSPLQNGVETDLFYEVATERSSKLERFFAHVTPGTGNYKYIGDVNPQNGLEDEGEFELTRFDGDRILITLPTDELFPVIDLKTSLRLRLTPSRFIQQPYGILGDIASVLTTETYVRVEEKSTERDLKQIYLLHFSKFRQDSTTIDGSSLYTQDINVFEGRPSFSSRFRYSQRKGLGTFSSGIERSYTRERSIRVRWQLVEEVSNQVDYTNKTDQVASRQPSGRLRDILSNSVAFDISYRPEQNVEVGFKVEVAKSTDRYQLPHIDASLNTQSVRLVYAFQGAGQARMEMAREEIVLGRGSENIPFELTGGRIVGKTWIWRAAFDYRVTQFIQATMNYDGRIEGGRQAVHTARAEVRAFF